VTANGEPFDRNKLTAAHRTLPLNTVVRVTNLESHKTVKIKVNDRGPFTGKRIIDLSERAARELGIVDDGVAQVKLEVFQSDQPGADQAASVPTS
jgi:rare lipoprotein A